MGCVAHYARVLLHNLRDCSGVVPGRGPRRFSSRAESVANIGEDPFDLSTHRVNSNQLWRASGRMLSPDRLSATSANLRLWPKFPGVGPRLARHRPVCCGVDRLRPDSVQAAAERSHFPNEDEPLAETRFHILCIRMCLPETRGNAYRPEAEQCLLYPPLPFGGSTAEGFGQVLLGSGPTTGGFDQVWARQDPWGLAR